MNAIFAAGAIELRAPLDQLFDASGAFFNENARRCLVAQAITGLQRVIEMQADFVVVAERGSDATLGVLSVRLGDLALGQAEDSACGREFNGSAQSRDSCAYYDEICLER